jgi:osmotically-inducible protein OsmY
MIYKASFDEASYYQGNNFQLGGSDRDQLRDGPPFKARNLSYRGDERILEDAWACLIRNHHIDLSGLDLDVREGVLRLTGKVSGLKEKWEIEAVLETVPGILEINNELLVVRI